MFTYLWCDAVEVPSRALCDPGQILTVKNITVPWAWQWCRVLQLLDLGLPVYPHSIFFHIHIQQLSIGCTSDLRQPDYQDWWDWWTKEQWRIWRLHTSGMEVDWLWWKLLNNLNRLYKKSWSGNRSVELDSVSFCVMPTDSDILFSILESKLILCTKIC